jgi:hypothetical protein
MVPYDEYERIKSKLDITQKECIRIADLYRNNRDAFYVEIDKIMAKIDTNPDYVEVTNDILMANKNLKDENATLKENISRLQEALVTKTNCINKLTAKVHELEKNIWDIQRIPHTDNSAVIERLMDENTRLKECLKHK